MHIIKGFFGWAVMLTGICTLFADELAVTPLTPVETPPLSTNGLGVGASISASSVVGVSGTNAIFVWNGSGYGGKLETEISTVLSNLYSTEVSERGAPAGPLKFLATTINTPTVPRLLAADSGFFALFVRGDEFVFTRLNKTGEPVMPLIRIINDPLLMFAAASNGKTVLLLYERFYATSRKVEYMLLDRNGATISTGLITDAVDRQFAVSSDGTNYLAAFQATEAPILRGTLFSGQDGSSTKFNIDTNALGISGLGHGLNGYLLASTNGLLQIREDGAVLNRTTSFPNVGPKSAIFEDSNGWEIFVPNDQFVSSVHISLVSGGLHASVGPYPSFAIAQTAPIENVVAPFGNGRYLIAQPQATEVLESNRIGELMRARTYSGQRGSHILSSPFGYCIAWWETDLAGARIRGLRLNRDGTQIDSNSFVIEESNNFPIEAPTITSAFDGEDYVFGWISTATATNVARVARISSSGVPNVRVINLKSLQTQNPFNLIEHKGTLYVWQLDFALTYNLHITSVDPIGNAGNEFVVRGDSIVSDGDNLYTLFNSSESGTFLQKIDPLSTSPEGEKIYAGYGPNPRAVSGPRGLLIYWNTNPASYAYFANGVGKFFEITAPSTNRFFALNENRLLIAETAMPLTKAPFLFTMVNLGTGERNIKEVDLGATYALDFASSGHDFLGVSSTIGTINEFIGKFWVTDADEPSFGFTHGIGPGIETRLTLNPTRHYRIESSEDLVNWNLEEEITGVSEHAVTNSGGEKRFIRAVLTPE